MRIFYMINHIGIIYKGYNDDVKFVGVDEEAVEDM